MLILNNLSRNLDIEHNDPSTATQLSQSNNENDNMKAVTQSLQSGNSNELDIMNTSMRNMSSRSSPLLSLMSQQQRPISPLSPPLRPIAIVSSFQSTIPDEQRIITESIQNMSHKQMIHAIINH